MMEEERTVMTVMTDREAVEGCVCVVEEGVKGEN